ncbi:MAG: SDR family NAD(P)-dependent oxidoreductase [Chitinophagales bacterium]|nr:SDR family NAD(P)-dependent oxidoreductase [Chitinophagales bacterium]
MANKTIIVTGASGNLGKAVVNYFLDQGDVVIGVVHRLRDGYPSHPNYKEVVIDLMSASPTTSAIEELLKTHPTVDVAVMTAGGFAMGNIEHTTLSDIQQQFNLNFVTAFNITSSLYPNMKTQGSGSVFFIGSGAGMDTSTGKGVLAYALSKSQLFQLANIINADAKQTGVKAFVIVPSTIDTPQNRASMPNADYSKWEKPEDIAMLIGRAAAGKESQPIIVVKDALAR